MVCRGYPPGKPNNGFHIIWKVLYSLGHGILTQRVKCRHTDKTITRSSREKFGQQVTFNLKLKACSVLFPFQNLQQSKEEQTHTMPSPQKEQNNPLPQTNAQDTLSEKHTKDDFCAVTINETSPLITRYVGLENQGATCYLNTVLQMLYMTELFREAVEGYGMNISSSTIINHITQLFECLKSGERNTATTEEITAELNINVYKQEDAAKCLQKILNKVNKVDPEISKIFQGEMAETTICINPEKVHEPLKQVKTFFILSISLNSEPPVHMQKCFDSYFAPIIMCREDQQVYCKDCAVMMNTKIISSLQKVPSVLVLHLERFEFDYDAMCCEKNYSSVQIPPQLLVKEEAGVNHTYDLYAIANHSGSLNGGHYYADIKDENGWHRFDDSTVNRLEMNLTCDSDIYSDEAYLLLYKKCESESPQNNSTQICKNPEDTAGPDVSISAGSKHKGDTFSVVSETESPEKKRKRVNSDSDSETEANASQPVPDDPVPDRESSDANHSQPTLHNSSGEMDSQSSGSECEKGKDKQNLQVLWKNSGSNPETEANASQPVPDDPVPDRESTDANHSQPTLHNSSGEMDSLASESELSNKSENEQDQQDLQVLRKNSVSNPETEANASQPVPDEPVPDKEIEPIDADQNQPTPNNSSGEMDSQSSGSECEKGKDQQNLQVLWKNSGSNPETEANASQTMPDESTLEIQSSDGDNDNQLKLLPSSAGRVSNRRALMKYYIGIPFLSLLVFLILFIISYYCPPHLLTFAVVVLLFSLICLLVLLARFVDSYLLPNMFTTGRNYNSQRSGVI